MIKQKLSDVPLKPGVYIFKDSHNRILYVGKAKNLRNRLKTYFQSSGGLDIRKTSMVNLIADFSYLVTENELEALILEATLIKQHKPRFNIVLRDDKNYPYLKLTVSEEWPRLEVVRRIMQDKNIYFGPYVPAQSMREAVSFIRKNFPLRTCRYNLDMPLRPCIQYQMGRCVAPCAGLIHRHDYMKIVDEVKLFLCGRRKELIKTLEKKMEAHSKNLEFEEASILRDRIKNLKLSWESQKIISPQLGDIDVIGFYSDSVDAAFIVFFIRNGILTGAKDFFLKSSGTLLYKEAVHGFIEIFYSKEIIPADKIIVRDKPDDIRNLEEWLAKRKGSRIKIKVPGKGKESELLKMADENAVQILNSRKNKGTDKILENIMERLNLTHPPGSIGAFDVSNTSGIEAVGAFIYWHNDEFVKDLYRHFRIKNVKGIDDYSMMKEIVSRALKNPGIRIPDLIIIDGGTGHLKAAKNAMEDCLITTNNTHEPIIVAVAKEPDRVIMPSGKTIVLDDQTPSSLLLKKIRDEAHRFAISHHRKLRNIKFMESSLEKINGIGKKRRLELLRHFGGIDAIKNATLEEISNIKGFNKYIAKRLLEALRYN